MKLWPFKRSEKETRPMIKERVLVFPKGTVVKFDGIPCELLQETPYESAYFRAKAEG